MKIKLLIIINQQKKQKGNVVKKIYKYMYIKIIILLELFIFNLINNIYHQ